MIGKLFRLAVVLVIGILVYNLFLGDESEKENARKIFGEVKEVGVAVKDLLKAEKQKFDEGKYDDAFDKVGNLFQKLKSRAKDIDEKYIDRIAELDEKRKELEKQLAALNKQEEAIPDEYGADSEFVQAEKNLDVARHKLTEELNDLMAETEAVMEEMEKE